MAEFDITDWADFVRGVKSPEIAEQMQNRLDRGATETRRTVDALRHVANLGRRDHDHPVPASAVRIVKAIAVTSRTEESPQIRRILCRIAFDSLLAPAAAGARGLQQSHRELTFEAHGYSIDLRLESEPTPSGLSSPIETPQVVVGQLLRLNGETLASRSEVPNAEERQIPKLRPVVRAPVFMFSGERLVGKALTGNHGEFQVEGPSREALELCILAGEDYLEMPLGAEPSGLGGVEGVS